MVGLNCDVLRVEDPGVALMFRDGVVDAAKSCPIPPEIHVSTRPSYFPWTH